MAIPQGTNQSGVNRSRMDALNGLPPLRDAINRARQVVVAANDESFGNLATAANDSIFALNEAEQEEHAAVMRARELSRFQHQSALGRVKAAALMALDHRKAIKAGDMSVFIPAFVFALAKDGFLDMIPGLGQVFGFPVAVYLFIFLWGHGVWKMRIKTRIIIGILSMLDIIPVIGMIPMSTMAVFYVYRQVSKKAFEARMELKELEKSM